MRDYHATQISFWTNKSGTSLETARIRRFIDITTLIAALYGLFVWLYSGMIRGEDSRVLILIDIRVYLAGAHAILTGAPLYGDPVLGSLYFTYPPFSAIFFIPFALLGEALGKAAWIFLTICLTYLVIRFLIGEIPGSSTLISPQAVVQASAFALFALDPMLMTLKLGQINILLMLFVVFDLVLIRPDKKGRWWSGALIGVAAGIKLTPILFILYLLWIRRWRAAVAAAAATSLTVIIGFLALPQESVLYWTKEIHNTERIGPAGSSGNQSAMGLLTRLTHGEPSQLFWLLIACFTCGAAFVAGGLAYRRGRSAYGGLLVGIAACVASPWSWGHHWVWACGLLIVLFADAAVYRDKSDVPARTWLVTLLPAIPLTLTLTLWPARWFNGLDSLVPPYYNAHPTSILSALYPLAGIAVIVWLLVFEVRYWRHAKRSALIA